MIGPRSFQI